MASLYTKNEKKEKEHDIQERFKELILEKRFMELAQMMSHTKAVPPDYVVRMGFRSYMQQEGRSNRVKLFFVMKLKEITNVTPEDSIMGEIIRVSFEMHSPHVLDSLCKRLSIEAAIFKTMDDEVQEAYLHHVKNGVFANVEKLTEVTGVQPSESIIQKGYEYYLREGKLISFTGLKNRTGIKPERKMVLEIFKVYQENAAQFDLTSPNSKEGNIWRKRIERLRKAMGSKTKEEKMAGGEEDI